MAIAAIARLAFAAMPTASSTDLRPGVDYLALPRSAAASPTRTTLTPKPLAAIHQGHQPLLGHDDMMRRLRANGENAARFDAFWNSFGMQAQVARQAALTMDCGITALPTFIVAGKFAVPPSPPAARSRSLTP